MNPFQKERQATADAIVNRLQNCVAEVFARYPVEIAYLHGSVAHGQPLSHSDIDIAVVLTDVPPAYERLMLELQIQAEIEDTCQLKNVDVRTINHAPITVRGEIVQEGQLLYTWDKAYRVAFEALTREMYFDYRPTAQRMQQAFLDYVQKHGLTHG